MRSLSPNDIIHIWETGIRRSHAGRALTILGYAFADASGDELAAMPLGERDRMLLQLRASTFGDVMQSYAECPSCSTRLEFGLGVRELLSDAEAAVAESDISVGEERIHIRPLNSRDVEAAARLTTESACSYLMRACIKEAGIVIDSDMEDHLAEHLATIDPFAEVLINLRCPDCGHDWQSVFDIASFFWTEISVQARRLLQDVATLARAYGWREADILEMSSARRAFYLEVVR